MKTFREPDFNDFIKIAGKIPVFEATFGATPLF
jgi:hypothetical protein